MRHKHRSNGRRIRAQCSPVDVGRLRASPQLLYELPCRGVEDSNEGPLRKHGAHKHQPLGQNTVQNPRPTRLRLLSPTQWLSACPGDLARCSTAPPRGRGCQRGASRCWPGPRSARGPSGCRGRPAESCCCWDTARRDLARTKAERGRL